MKLGALSREKAQLRSGASAAKAARYPLKVGGQVLAAQWEHAVGADCKGCTPPPERGCPGLRAQSVSTH